MIFGHQGLRISYDDAGSGNAVLFIHGHPFNRTMWRPQIQSLRWKYRTIAPDLRGYGETSVPAEPAIPLETMAGDLVALLDHLGVERVCVVGLSMGGQIAMEFARAFPDRTAAAVFAATFPQGETPEGVERRNKMADRLIAEGMAPTGCEMIPKLIGPASLRKKPAIASFVYEMICSTDPVGAAAAVRGRAMRRDYRESVTQFKFPCMIAIGTDDSYTTVEEAKAMQAAMQGSRLEIFPGIGHMPNLEDEDRFNRHLHEFLPSAKW
ncbi:MAG TPA: alpha/beta hydrolase [Bryobacteraceae bacterium]|nr:alpha/beta hydrolase [Bryobacteraceae bacterium]